MISLLTTTSRPPWLVVFAAVSRTRFKKRKTKQYFFHNVSVYVFSSEVRFVSNCSVEFNDFLLKNSHGAVCPIDVVKTRIQLEPAKYNSGMLGGFKTVEEISNFIFI